MRVDGRTLIASQPRTPVGFSVPEVACDCHVHVFGRAERFPSAERRGYTPPLASAEECSHCRTRCISAGW
jgi:hypothetical protein